MLEDLSETLEVMSTSKVTLPRPGQTDCSPVRVIAVGRRFCGSECEWYCASDSGGGAEKANTCTSGTQSMVSEVMSARPASKQYWPMYAR